MEEEKEEKRSDDHNKLVNRNVEKEAIMRERDVRGVKAREP